MPENPSKKGNERREQAVEEVAEMRKKTAEKRAELQGIVQRYRSAIAKQDQPKHPKPSSGNN